ncbi:HipA domain-containing protein [Leifsonia sp. NPDC056824]|uniref:HipA domain-containing protein n=1 Tax=Leifsonia sp. NPDC056824 TaxID=3345953 RepID=UPI0036B21DEA
MARRLIAYVDGVRTGVFQQSDAGAITYTYDSDIDVEATPLSVSMPLIPGATYKNAVARPFLQGLLPDNDATLGALAATFHTSAKNPMALLEHVGRDTAGALQLLPPDRESDDAAKRTGDVRYVEDFDDLIADIVKDAAVWQRERDQIRWSLAGAQPKVALHRTSDGRWAVPLDSTPTTHILKPAAAGTRHDLNEFVTMRAARHLGLLVAHHEILTTAKGDHVFVSRRYDRTELDGRLHRLHQEDFAQALSVDPARKYQQDGGPGVADFARVLAAMPPTAAFEARRSLFDALVYTVSAVNTDAHAKDYSVIHFGAQMALAPLYDLGSNVLYRGEYPVESAVSIGGERVMDRIGEKQFLAAAKTLQVDADYAIESVQRIRGGVAEAFLAARSEVQADAGGLVSVSDIVDGIAARARSKGWSESAATARSSRRRSRASAR